MSEVERRDVLRYAVSVGLVPQHPPLLLLAHFVGHGHLKQILCRAPIKHGAVHVGCGSTAVIRRRACYLRFAPNNGRTRDIGQCRGRANSRHIGENRHVRPQQRGRYHETK